MGEDGHLGFEWNYGKDAFQIDEVEGGAWLKVVLLAEVGRERELALGIDMHDAVHFCHGRDYNINTSGRNSAACRVSLPPR